LLSVCGFFKREYADFAGYAVFVPGAPQMKNLAVDPAYGALKGELREKMFAKMGEIGDSFEACSWYEKHWTRDRLILRTARGRHGRL
jgi:hypothetical protein